MNVNLDKACKTFGKRAEEKTDLAVFTCIAEYTNPEGRATVPQSTIAEETGYTRRTVSNSIHRLAEKGFLTIEKDATGYRGIAANIYHINSKYLTKPGEQSNTGTRSRVRETQMAAPGCVNLEEALLELGSDDVNEKAKKVFTLIARHADKNGEARILLHDITTETHISAKVVKDKIDYLHRMGFIKVSKEFVNTDTTHYYRNVYTINPRFLRHMPAACCESEPNSESRSKTNDIQGLARLGIVMADVVKEIFSLYEEKSSK